MRLSARPILNFQTVNSFNYANQWFIRFGDPNTLYFQIIDLDQCGHLRYMAGVGSQNQPAAIQVTFPSIDNSKVLTFIAIQNISDLSIWSVSIPQSATPFSGNVKFAIMEGTATRQFFVLDMIKVEYPQNTGSDGILSNSPAVYGNPEGI